MKKNIAVEEKIIAYIDNHKQDIINDVSTLVQQNTVYDEKTVTQKQPRGKNIAEGFKVLEKLLKTRAVPFWHYETETNDYGFFSFGDINAKKMIIFVCHLDTVPFDDINKWRNKNPLSGDNDEKFIYGRGALDDKGPISCALWATKSLINLNIKLPFEIRTFVGADEETRFAAQNFYLQKHKRPNVSLVLDGEFPFSYIEKSIHNYSLKIKTNDSLIQEIDATNTINMVPGHCNAIVKIDYERLLKIFNIYLEENSVFGKLEKIDKNLTKIYIEGKSTHAIFAKNGINSITYMFDFLSGIGENSKVPLFVKTYLHDDFYGDKLNINFIDSKLDTGSNFNFGCVEKKGNVFEFKFNIRFLKHLITDADIQDEILTKASKWFGSDNVSLEVLDAHEGYMVDINSELWQTVYKTYQSATNDYTSKPIVSAGGTYAKFFPNAVCIGPILPEDNYNAHCVDEKMPINSLIKATKIYAIILYRLALNLDLII